MKLTLWVAGALIAVTCALPSSPAVSKARATAMKIGIGQKAPDFSLPTPEGERITLSDYAGEKVVLLEFWATWCGICIGEIPVLNKSYEKYRDQGFEILAVALQSGSEEDVREAVEEHGIQYPVLIDEGLHVAKKLYGLAGPIPVKVILGCDGVVRYSHVGDYLPGEDEVPLVVEALLAECGDDQETTGTREQ